MAEKNLQANERCIEYFLFPLLKKTKPVQEELSAYLDAIFTHLSRYLIDYIWLNEGFNLALVDPQDENIPPHFHGSTKIGLNSNDEWFITYMLMELTKTCSDLVVRVICDDDYFLLLEKGEPLPHWLNNEMVENRVFIYQGNINIVPLQKKSGALVNFPDRKPTLSEAVNLIRTYPNVTKDGVFHSFIRRKVNSYPSKVRDEQHVAHCYLPAALAVILKKDPALLSAAVHAFCTRDAVDLKTCRMMKFFPPEMRVMTAVTFTKCLYAQLIKQNYTPDRLVGWNIPASSHPLFKAYDLGMKLACGFEILVSNCNPKKSNECSFSFPDFSSDSRWSQCLQALADAGYFHGEAEGSKMYAALLEKAQRYFYSNIFDRTGLELSDGQKIRSLLDSIDVDIEQLTEEMKTLQPPDDDYWLSMSPGSSCQNRNVPCDTHESGNDVPDVLKRFNNRSSEADGADAATRKTEQSGKSNKAKRVTMDPDAFADAYQSILDFKLPDWEEGSSSEMSDYSEDDAFQETDLSKPSGGNKRASMQKILNRMEAYMEKMDGEIPEANLNQNLQSLSIEDEEGKGSSEVEARDDAFDDYAPPVESDLSALRNILETYHSQSEMSTVSPASRINSMSLEVSQGASE